MPFPPNVREEALVRSRRCCCVCHEFHGRYVEVHHVEQEAHGGANTIDNAIVLCMGCHGEAGHYNPAHPLGSKYKPSELLRHRDEWWSWCANNPQAPLPHSPITVTPSEIVISSGGWNRVAVVRIHNRTDAPLFQVWLQIIPKGIAPQSMTFDLKRRQEEPALSVGPATIKTDAFGLRGLAPDGQPCAGLRLTSIEPGETFRLTIGSKETGHPASTSYVTASVLLESFEEKPEPVQHRRKNGGEQAAFPFTNPAFFSRIDGLLFELGKPPGS